MKQRETSLFFFPSTVVLDVVQSVCLKKLIFLKSEGTVVMNGEQEV